ncbi:sensor histidine kinase [Romboutsia sedimentorum]|uniref:histidine kinase n=1 Tax=Romboutsia sedimentorum TaxID=1368474 RepID=A0ABT7EC92_9FIRM|nr:sensor histidine kinase [Romboutsia sedimentorum]MDK2563678.1 sensor histidine kinase [Romboutsia sedimentorum]
MNIIDYIKNKFKYIAFVCVLLGITNIYLYSLNSFKDRYGELIYLDILLIMIIIVFFILDYINWRNKYKDIYECIEINKDIGEYLILGNSFEEEIMREIILDKSKYNDMEISKYKNSLKEIDEYIAKWVHEIKIPISSLNIITDRLEDIEDSMSVRNQVEKMNFLVNSILYGSKSTSLFEDVFINKVNLNSLVKKSIKNNSFLLIRNNIDIDIKNLDYEIYTDIKCILYVLNQLINNSIKYSRKSGKIEFSANKEEDCVVLNIKDYGIGIYKEDLSRVFDKGFTGVNGREKMYKSTGMGLYFSRKIIDKLGHNIYVNSEKDVYTEFNIYFYNISDYLNLNG